MATNPNTVPQVTVGVPNAGGGSQAPIFGAAIQQVIVIANGSGTQRLALSTFPNVDATGVTDSSAAVNTAIYAAAAAGFTVYWDAPIYVKRLVNYASTIFMPASVSIEFSAEGVLITDAVMTHVFDICNVSDVTFVNLTVKYIGTFGVTAIDQQNPADPNHGTIANYNSGTATTYMASGLNFAANTFSGSGNYLFPSATNACALIHINGACDRIQFLGKTRFYVPDGAPACNFLPFAISLFAQWLPGIAVNSTVQNAGPLPATAAVPNHVLIEDIELDGVLMGVCGTATNLKINKQLSKRYSDLQDANGNNLGGQNFTALSLSTAPVAGNNFITLAAVYPSGYSNVNSTITLSDGSQYTGAFVPGSANVTLTTTIAGGTYTTANTSISYSQNWFAPPHRCYVHSLDSIGSFPMTYDITLFDEGTYVGSANTRLTGSGYINTIKAEPANGSTFNVNSKCPHGGVDWLTFNNANGGPHWLYSQMNTAVGQQQTLTFTASITSGATSANLTAPWPYANGSYTTTFSNNVVRSVTVIRGQIGCTFTSLGSAATAVANVINTSQLAFFGYRFPNSPPMIGFPLNAVITDTAAVPAGWPCQGDGQFLNTDCEINCSVTVQDINGTYSPSTAMGGTNHILKERSFIKNMSTTTTGLGMIVNQGSTIIQQSDWTNEITGWRTLDFVFGTLGSSTATFAGSYTWPYPTGLYQFSLSDGQQIWGNVSNGGTTVTWVSTPTGTPTTVATAYLLNPANYDNYKQRILVMQQGKGPGLHCLARDLSNGIDHEVQNGTVVETWKQFWTGSVVGAASASPQTLPIAYPAGFGILMATGKVITALNTGTWSLGTSASGQAAALISAASGVINTDVWTPPLGSGASAFPYTLTTSALAGLIFTPSSGSALTTGVLEITVIGQRSQQAQ